MLKVRVVISDRGQLDVVGKHELVIVSEPGKRELSSRDGRSGPESSRENRQSELHGFNLRSEATSRKKDTWAPHQLRYYIPLMVVVSTWRRTCRRCAIPFSLANLARHSRKPTCRPLIKIAEWPQTDAV